MAWAVGLAQKRVYGLARQSLSEQRDHQRFRGSELGAITYQAGRAHAQTPRDCRQAQARLKAKQINVPVQRRVINCDREGGIIFLVSLDAVTVTRRTSYAQ
jgi:hypothetical protein